MNKNEEIRKRKCEVRDRYIRIYGEEAFWNRTMQEVDRFLEENNLVFTRLKDK